MIELMQLVKEKMQKVFFLLFLKSSFKKFGKRSTLCFPFRINGSEFVSIGEKVHIYEGSWILALKNDDIAPIINIGNGTYVGRFSHIVGVSKVEICNNVLISDKVYISDNIHDYNDVNTPIKEQRILKKFPVVIGENTWLGENVCIIGASVGKHCVIGANSVVTNNIPDYSIAVGTPAKVIKTFNHTSKIWEKVN